MEWLILLLLVPAIVTPVVLLYGFAGCGFSNTVGPSPADPTNVHVASKDLDGITIAWDYMDEPPHHPVTFEVEINATDPPGQTFGIPDPQKPQEFPHTGLQEGKVFGYRVRAILTSNQVSSKWVPDPPLREATLSFQTAFQATLVNNDGGNDGACTVQRIEPAGLLPIGTVPNNSKVRITLRGPTAGGLTLDRVTISRAAVPSDDPVTNPVPDPYDSGPGRTDVATAVVVPTNGIHVVPPVAYQLDKNAPLLIAFNINNTAGQGTLRFVGNVPANVATMYSRQNTPNEAATNNRTAGYLPQPRIHIVERIDVAAETPLP